MDTGAAANGSRRAAAVGLASGSAPNQASAARVAGEISALMPGAAPASPACGGLAPWKLTPPSVSVPVLSRHTVSTRARTSTAGCSWMRTSRRASFRAATANEMVVMSARPCGIMLVTAATDAISAGSSVSSRGAESARPQPPAAVTWPFTITAMIGTRAIVSQRATFSRPSRSSEWIARYFLASAPRRAACESGPTAVARTSPVPATTEEPESTASPGRLGTGSFSPVRRASSRSRPSEASTSASTGTWSPRRSTTTSSSTIWTIRTGTRSPSRTTRASSWFSRAIRSRVRLAEYSCTTPMTTLATAARLKRRSNQRPSRTTTSAHRPMARLNSVSTCTRRMVARLREVSRGCAFVRPAASRSATSAWVSPQIGSARRRTLASVTP